MRGEEGICDGIDGARRPTPQHSGSCDMSYRDSSLFDTPAGRQLAV